MCYDKHNLKFMKEGVKSEPHFAVSKKNLNVSKTKMWDMKCHIFTQNTGKLPEVSDIFRNQRQMNGANPPAHPTRYNRRCTQLF